MPGPNSTQLVGENGMRFTVHRQPLYDTQVRTSASSVNTEYRYFSNVQNQPLYITNLTQNSQLEKGNSFQCHGINMEAISMDATKSQLLYLLGRNSSISLKISDKTYYQAALSMVAGGISQNAALAGATDAAQSLQQYGMPRCQGVSFGKNPWNIDSQQGFVVLFSTQNLSGAELTAATPSADNDIHIKCILKGLYTKPIQ